jgi:hypothetical protein
VDAIGRYGRLLREVRVDECDVAEMMISKVLPNNAVVGRSGLVLNPVGVASPASAILFALPALVG